MSSSSETLALCDYCNRELEPEYDYSCPLCCHLACDSCCEACQVEGCDDITCFGCVEHHLQINHPGAEYDFGSIEPAPPAPDVR